MATVRESLIAAKALIDTPEKYLAVETAAGTTGAFKALNIATRYDLDSAWLAVCELRRVLPDKCGRGVQRFCRAVEHADIMDLFDRAIAAQVEE